MHVWTQTGGYATPAAAPVTESPHFTLPPFPPASLLVHRLLYSVSVSPNNSPHPSRSETQSIATGFPLIRLADAHKWSYCLCIDQLIGSFGCLFCYCPLIGAQGVLTVYRHMWATAEPSGLEEKGWWWAKDGRVRSALKAISQDGWGHEPKRRRQIED